MAHHRGYVGGWSTWGGHFRVQMSEQTALAGSLAGPIAWTGLAWGLAWGGSRLVRREGGRDRPSDMRIGRSRSVLLLVLGLIPTAAWWVTLARVPFWFRSTSSGLRVLGVAWVVQAVLTPLYHPYARLWLPLEALGWFALAEVVSGRRGKGVLRSGGLDATLCRLRGAVVRCPALRGAGDAGGAALERTAGTERRAEERLRSGGRDHRAGVAGRGRSRSANSGEAAGSVLSQSEGRRTLDESRGPREPAETGRLYRVGGRGFGGGRGGRVGDRRTCPKAGRSR